MILEWDIIHVMDRVIARAKEGNWYNLQKILDEYTIFIDDDRKDREEATLNGVDMSDANSLFSMLVFRIWCVDALQKNLVEQHRGDVFARVLRNLFTIPNDEYRGGRMWELLFQMTDFVLKVEPNSFAMSFDESVTVGYDVFH